MDGVEQACPDCGTAVDATDNYCRHCGMYLAALRVPATVAAESRAMQAHQRSSLPAPVKKAAVALAVGTALQVGVGIAGRYIAAQAAKQAASAAVNGARKPARVNGKSVRGVEPEPEPEMTAVSETVVVRRVWIRRG